MAATFGRDFFDTVSETWQTSLLASPSRELVVWASAKVSLLVWALAAFVLTSLIVLAIFVWHRADVLYGVLGAAMAFFAVYSMCVVILKPPPWVESVRRRNRAAGLALRLLMAPVAYLGVFVLPLFAEVLLFQFIAVLGLCSSVTSSTRPCGSLPRWDGSRRNCAFARSAAGVTGWDG